MFLFSFRKWSEAAAKEANKFHHVHQVNHVEGLDALTGLQRSQALQESILNMDDWTLKKDAKYFYFC